MSSKPAIYFSTLEIENVRCFGGRQELALMVDGRPAPWTLIVGENGTGKTTLLECLAWMCPVPRDADSSLGTTGTGEIPPLTVGTLTAALPEADNEVLETLPRDMSTEVKLRADLAFGGIAFNSTTTSEAKTSPFARVDVGTNLEFNEAGELQNLELTTCTQIENLPEPFQDPLIVAYGANRILGKQNLGEIYERDPLDSRRLSEISELCDVEELLMDLDYAARADQSGPESKVVNLLKNAISRILPEKPVVEIEVAPPDVLGTGRPAGVYAKTFTGQVRMSALSLGYRSTAGWVIDFASRLFKKYPSSPNPLAEPAVVLIDEIDLHLHPLWQLVIIKELSELFPATQFIATSHSPLIVQVAEEANLVLLEKQEGQVKIENDPNVPRGLRVDQILTSLLFGVPSSRSPKIQMLLEERASLLDKPDLTDEEENRLTELRRQINDLPVTNDPGDQVAMDLIRRFAASLEREKEHDQ